MPSPREDAIPLLTLLHFPTSKLLSKPGGISSYADLDENSLDPHEQQLCREKQLIFRCLVELSKDITEILKN